VRRYPQFGNFFVRSNMAANKPHTLAHQYLSRDVGLAIELGLLKHSDVGVAIDLIVGATFAGVQALLFRPKIESAYPEKLTYHILLGIGMSAAAAQRLVALPLRPIQVPADSLLERSSLRIVERDTGLGARRPV
jgi:hypothetical protein